MKRYNNLKEEILKKENLYKAIQKSSLGKRNQKSVKSVLDNIDRYAIILEKILREETFVPNKGIKKTIQDISSGKVREIIKPNFFPDQCVHWALVLVLEKVIMRGMYQYTCGSVPGRGTTYGQNALRKWLDNDWKNTKYVLKMDVSKYYPSVDNERMKLKFRRVIKDEFALNLIDLIIDSHQGLPIGFYTSQWFANFYLQNLDHYIKEELGAKYYIRYVDDLVILGSNKRELAKTRQSIDEYLKKEKLSTKQNWQIWQVNNRDIDFLGIRFYRDKSILRKRNALRIKRRMTKISTKGYLNEQDALAYISYWGWIKRTDSFNFYKQYMKSIVPIKYAKKVVSANAKLRNGGCNREVAYLINEAKWIQL
jgi:hypothetical protein